jgi:hypothetical protein
VTTIVRFSQLSPSKQTLIRVMQSLNYGSILNLGVADGELHFDPPADVLVDIRLDEDPRARSEVELGDFSLGLEVRRLLAQIDAIKNGTIEKIVIHAGVPRRVILRSSLRRNAIEGSPINVASNGE